MESVLSGIACRRLYTPDMILDDVLVQFDGPRIGVMGSFASSSLPDRCYNAREAGLVVAPGLIDTHVHGCGGADFLDCLPESVDRIRRTAARGGASSIVATTTINIRDEDLSRFERQTQLIREAMREEDASVSGPGGVAGARILGMFLEGPYLNMSKRGGYGESYVHPVDLAKVRRVLEICGDILRMITVAPEIDGADELVDLILGYPGVEAEISVGHTGADYELAARFLGRERVRHVTHAFNAMDPFHHRAPNLIGRAMLDERVTLEMVCDGHHLSGPAVELLYRIKGRDRLLIVTDGTAVTGSPPGTRIRSVGGWTEVVDGVVRLPDGTIAGSSLLMAGALACIQRIAAVPFEDALRMATVNPARVAHRDAEVGSIEPGKRADFCVLRADGGVAATIRDGCLVYGGEA